MNPGEQQAAFAGDLHDLIDRYRKEFDLHAVAVIGILAMEIRYIQDELIEDSK